MGVFDCVGGMLALPVPVTESLHGPKSLSFRWERITFVDFYYSIMILSTQVKLVDIIQARVLALNCPPGLAVWTFISPSHYSSLFYWSP